jgi:hypothetical protein
MVGNGSILSLFVENLEIFNIMAFINRKKLYKQIDAELREKIF